MGFWRKEGSFFFLPFFLSFLPFLFFLSSCYTHLNVLFKNTFLYNVFWSSFLFPKFFQIPTSLLILIHAYLFSVCLSACLSQAKIKHIEEKRNQDKKPQGHRGHSISDNHSWTWSFLWDVVDVPRATSFPFSINSFWTRSGLGVLFPFHLGFCLVWTWADLLQAVHSLFEFTHTAVLSRLEDGAFLKSAHHFFCGIDPWSLWGGLR